MYQSEPDVNDLGRDPRVNLALSVLRQMKDSLDNVISLLESGAGEQSLEALKQLTDQKQLLDVEIASATGQRTIEGVFDGSHMVGSDGNIYNVPPNYASKSRLVEGDLLKLTIRQDGTFVFKQIGPMERKRVTGLLAQDSESGDYFCVDASAQRYKLISASVTYYHGVVGDEVVILVPKSAPSTWGAVENIVKRA